MTEKVFGSEKKGSIQDIPLPQDHNEKKSSGKKTSDSDDHGKKEVESWGNAKRRNKRSRSKILIALGAVVFFLAIYTWLFHSAYVEVVPKSQSVTVANQEFEAISEGEGLAFTRSENINKTISSFVAGSVEENRQTKTTGTLTVYNTDSSVKNYIKNTRFQSEDGRVYRAFQRFVIPKGTESNPGSVDILVVAENPGDKYNSEGGLSFKLPALKEGGDPAYDSVYAEQKEALTGGFSGVIKVPSVDDVESAKRELENQVTQDLIHDFVSSVSDEFVISDDFLSISEVTFTEKPNAEKGGLDIEARVELDAVMFARDEFSRYMSGVLLENVAPTDVVTITNPGELLLAVEDEDFNPASTEAFTFTLTGEVNFQWNVEESEIQSILAGNLKSHVNSGLIAGLQNTSSVSASISPFWRRSIPQDTDSIEVVITK